MPTIREWIAGKRSSRIETTRLYQQIATLIQAVENCRKSENTEWEKRHTDSVMGLVREFMPSGSGCDNGTAIFIEDSKPNRLVLAVSFHHMNEGGCYDGWSHHKVIVTPDLASGFDLRITGRDRNDIKEYLVQLFREALDQEIERAPVQEIAS